MKKIFILVALLFVFVGCGSKENENIEQKEDTNNVVVEAPVVDGFELDRTSQRTGYNLFYYYGDFETDEARDIFVAWAESEGWTETEDSMATTKILSHPSRVSSMTISSYRIYEGPNTGLVEVLLSYPQK